jgi:hypothetical protein
MVQISKYSQFYIQVNTEDKRYLEGLKEYFSEYVNGFQYSPKFQSGMWDGKVYMFSPSTRTLPYGLLTELIRFHKKYYPDTEFHIEKSVKSLFSGEEPKFT